MTALRLATWNVNSIRTRLDRVTDWLARAQVDVLAMQETKCTDAQFPTLPFHELGYEVAHVGHNQWNGVAIASRVGLTDVEVGFPGQPAFGKPGEEPAVEARALGATCGGVRVWSLYVPNGRTLDDPHYAYKLDWLSALADRSALWLAHDPAAQIMLAGDWNVAPTDDDVWDRDYFDGKTHVTDAERQAVAAFAGHGFTDVALPYAPGYTFWDYTQLRFPRDEGMRIDYLLCSPALGDRVFDARIDREARKAKGASDHAPVVLEIS